MGCRGTGGIASGLREGMGDADALELTGAATADAEEALGPLLSYIPCVFSAVLDALAARLTAFADSARAWIATWGMQQ